MELPPTRSWFTFPAPTWTNQRALGAPCWQYGQFIRNEDNTLSFVAVYRSQDFFQEALGNFVGLTRLLKFVCQRAGMMPGTLACPPLLRRFNATAQRRASYSIQ